MICSSFGSGLFDVDSGGGSMDPYDFTDSGGEQPAKYVVAAAQKYGIDPYLMLSIAMQESSMGTNKVDNDRPYYSHRIMQVDPGNDIDPAVIPSNLKAELTAGVSLNENGRYNIEDLFPEARGNPADRQQNCEAGMLIFLDKLSQAHGDVDEAIVRYNGGGDPKYFQKINSWHVQLTGMPLVAGTHLSLSTEEVSAYWHIVLFIVTIVLVAIFCTGHISSIISGPAVLP